MHSCLTAHCAFQRQVADLPFSFTGRFPFLASPLRSRLANASGRIEFIIVLFMDWSFASGCSPPRLSATQLPSATDRPVFLSDRDFHPTVGAVLSGALLLPLRGVNVTNSEFVRVKTLKTWFAGSTYKHAVPVTEEPVSYFDRLAISFENEFKTSECRH